MSERTTNSREDANKASVLGWLRAREVRMDLEHMATFLTEDASRYGPRPSFLEGGPRETARFGNGPALGRDRLLHGFSDDGLPYEPGSITVEVENMIAEGDY